MTTRFAKQSCLLALLSTLVLSSPAFAKDAEMNMERAPKMSEEMRKDRSGMRQEMDTLRKEHEALEQAREALLDKCIPTEKDKAEACIAERKELRERTKALREQAKAIHDKMGQRHKGMMDKMKVGGEPPSSDK